MNLLESALYYGENYQWSIFPCASSDTKKLNNKPLIDDWFSKSTPNPEMIRHWWGRWPNANIGINCGKSNLLGFDIDWYKGGARAWSRLIRSYHLSDTATTRTFDGRHVFYKCAQSNSLYFGLVKGVGLGVSVRAGKDWLVLPPSRHASGVLYKWIKPPNYLIPAPAEFVEILSNKRFRFWRTVEYVLSEIKRKALLCGDNHD